MKRRTHFLLYSRINASNIRRSLGAPEYSYYFLLKEFRPVFERLGPTVVVHDPSTEADLIFDRCRESGEDCVLIAFTAPQNLPDVRRCPVIPLFAWEFERVPDEAWGDNPRNDWRVALAGSPGAITLSEHAVAAVGRTLGSGFPVLAVPVPLWERMAAVRERDGEADARERQPMTVTGAVIDTRDYEMGPDRLRCTRPYASYTLDLWDGEEQRLDFRLFAPDTGALLGFYRPEEWGAWSRNAEVFIALPWLLCGEVVLELEMRAYGRNQGRPLVARLGDAFQPLCIGGGEERHELRFRLERPARMLHIMGMDPRPLAGAAEERGLGIGVTSLRLCRRSGPLQQDPIRLDLRAGAADGALLQGFHAREEWGAWSACSAPWLVLPRPVQGHVSLEMDLLGNGGNVDAPIQIYLGSQARTVCPGANLERIRVEFDLPQPAQVLGFADVREEPAPDPGDRRSLGIGLCGMTIEDSAGAASGEPAFRGPLRADVRQLLLLDGIVYTSILNPCDDRKNWVLVVSAFCTAFADRDDVTLLLKMTHNLQRSYVFDLHNLMQRLPRFSCRVVLVHGFLDDEDYGRLIRRTDFYVNASKAEGLCIPLMEFMSCGKPALAPRHTSLLDFVDDANSIPIESSTEPCIWPHDEREVFRTLQYRVSWASTVAAFLRSRSLYLEDPQAYRRMGEAAARSMAGYCGIDRVTGRISAFVESVLAADGQYRHAEPVAEETARR